MEIIPALDIREGSCVQLIGGDVNRERLRVDPFRQLEKFVDDGASRVHIVDLDGALGEDNNRSLVKLIIGAAKDSVSLQVGGGVRSIQDIEELLNAGANKVVLGTRAVKEPKWLERVSWQFGDKLIVAMDAKGEKVAVDGWRNTSNKTIHEMSSQVAQFGVSGVLYTDIGREGLLEGPNIEVCKKLADELGAEVLASGGIASINDLDSLYEAGVDGAIVGTAAYTGHIALREVLKSPNYK